MYTGIIAGVGRVVAIKQATGLTTLQIELPANARNAVEIGASIAIDGVCLTVAAFTESIATFDVMQQTLATTTLGTLNCSSRVNVERSAKAQQEIGGHELSGHIDCTAEVVAIETPDNNRVVTLRVPEPYRKYIFAKGFLALHGASLTVASFEPNTGDLTVWLIPETLRLTTFAEKKVGDRINVEVDRKTQVLVDTVYRFLQENQQCFFGMQGN